MFLLISGVAELSEVAICCGKLTVWDTVGTIGAGEWELRGTRLVTDDTIVTGTGADRESTGVGWTLLCSSTINDCLPLSTDGVQFVSMLFLVNCLDDWMKI